MGEHEKNDVLLCSRCFKNYGVELQARFLGKPDKERCPNCNSNIGFKLNRDALLNLANVFFVEGSIQKFSYGEAPLIQFNEHHKKNSVRLPCNLQKDADLLSLKLEIGFFDYGPRLWMIGEVEPLQKILSKKQKSGIISKIFNEFPAKILTHEDIFYRMRANPKDSNSEHEYDSSPILTNQGRMNSKGESILYASQDLDTCIHECRISVEDKIYFATLSPRKNLTILDLTVLLEEDCTEFESLDIAMHMIFLAGSHSYKVTQEIAKEAKRLGFDGIAYPSYFTWLRMGLPPLPTAYGISYRKLPDAKYRFENMNIQNYAIFGRPIVEGLLKVVSINKVVLRRVDYAYSLGPASIG